jgi:hypothetical protein
MINDDMIFGGKFMRLTKQKIATNVAKNESNFLKYGFL